MRLSAKKDPQLVDLPLVQAMRLRNPEILRALNEGAFDPFPDGTTAPEDSSLAKNSGLSDVALVGGALNSFDSALPDHIQDALQQGLHADDDGMQAFFALFDRRLMQLRVRAEQAAVLVATQDHAGQQAASVLDRLARLVKQDGSDPRFIQVLAPLLSRARTLEGLREMVSWWCGRPVEVTADFSHKLPIDPDCRTRLSAQPHPSAALGRGALLGASGHTPMGRVSVEITCMDRADLDALTQDSALLLELQAVIAQYMRDPVPVTLFADVARAHLDAPRLSASAGAARLGTYSILQPERRTDARSAIKLAGILS
ncbi:type VI secretion protein, family [Tritonibacter multivorans]|uniref:Type VI secretion protein, family n=1 Tax=Tritonibacter multivorans TaxID=928856 RepID=A0A0N7LZR1_9RHOB|nr:type VI secretion system baseplate subunit TssG [Tritonibacter multivorans]MDA7422149.1 type VI secretion system baseplate subunit TssG [Tritonibacter multivorans]CUH78369.1 type VI secretion protein, family [Tritonibacter multivorans]SFD15896.1 Predicted component of the type VI protein secretion system [Tritonibacter multivorans]